MSEHCQITNAIEKIRSASHCNVAYIGGSLTVGVGAGDVTRTSWRALFSRHLFERFHARYHCQISEIMGAIGACESYVAAFTLGRNVLPCNPDLAFIEFCVNDAGAPDGDLVLKGMEGMVRQLLAAKNTCDVILVGMGNRPNNVDQTPHRRVAEHYDLPFIDMQGFLLENLKQTGRTWDDVAIEFEENDPHHLNDEGNRLCFEAVRAELEAQLAAFDAGKRKARRAPLPDPLVSDELQHAKLVDPSRKQSGLTLAGSWSPREEAGIPWYFDNLLVGRPGDSLTFRFTGTAVAAFGLMYNNGLKLEAKLDGEEIRGAYLRHFIQFGKGVVLAHGLPNTEHELTLTVGPASKRHNKLQDPSAQIAYLGVAQPPAPAAPAQA